MSRLQIVHSIQRIACTKCGAEANASCNCGAAYEVVAAEKERQRQKAKAWREKEKDKQNQSTRTGTEDSADRAEARCATEWKSFTAQEERNAVSNILEAIRDLTDEQRALLFQTLKDSYQWTP